MDQRNPSTATLRIIDANTNRACEGLRVVEDYLRFALDDGHLAGHCKRLRHELGSHVQKHLFSDARLSTRDTQQDVGTQIRTEDEYQRSTEFDVVAASIKRVQQSLRCLEEYGKAISVDLSTKFESLRYESYTLEKAIVVTKCSINQFQGQSLYVLMPGCGTESDFVKIVDAVIHGGAHIVQLRDKSLEDRVLLQRARLLRERTRNTNTLFIMNDRPDLAHLSDADGVHVGQEELTVKDARQIIGPSRLIGVSTHSIEQARCAVLDGANYIGVGPTFPSNTKQFNSFTGLELLRAVSAEIKLPAFAIGGINQTNLPQVLATGIQRFAVSSAVVDDADPEKAAQNLLLGVATVSTD